MDNKTIKKGVFMSNETGELWVRIHINKWWVRWQYVKVFFQSLKRISWQ